MRRQFERLLPDWALSQSEDCELVEGNAWSDGNGLTICGGSKGVYDVSFAHVASFRVNVSAKTVQIISDRSDRRLGVEHLLLDQIVPRILAHSGDLMIHGASVLVDDRLIVIIGKSGQGKSTLTSWFVAEGHQILGDDALKIAGTAPICASGLAAKLRLKSDTAHSLGSRIPAVAGEAGYAGKVQFDLVEPNRSAVPIAAIFRLAEPSEKVKLSVVSSTTACMALVEESFALDPSDLDQANSRLKAAAIVAEQVPFYDLSYPRSYARLREVSDAILAVL